MGMRVFSAKISRLLCENTLATIQSTIRSSTLAISDSGSRVPNPISVLLKKMQCPPICLIPTSKLTRVLKEGFSNTRATVLSERIFGAPFVLMFKAF